MKVGYPGTPWDLAVGGAVAGIVGGVVSDLGSGEKNERRVASLLINCWVRESGKEMPGLWIRQQRSLHIAPARCSVASPDHSRIYSNRNPRSPYSNIVSSLTTHIR